MANVVEACLRRIYNSIPIDILNVALQPTQLITLDSQIQDKIILERVLPDCNIVGGKITKIVLQSDWIEVAEVPTSYMFGSTAGYSIYRIPAQARENKEISSCISVDYPYSFSGNMHMPGLHGGGITAGDIACQVLNSQTWANNIPLPTPIKISGNQVKLTPVSLSPIQNLDWVLTCRLMHDQDFTNLNNQAILPLIELVFIATKAFIFNELALKIDTAYIVGGQQLGRFREIVDSYMGANDEYLAALRSFNGANTVLDPMERRRRIKDML